MSMNLHLELNGKDFDLWQTPTYITYMCLTTSSGSVQNSLIGKKALRGINSYIEWVKGRLESSMSVEDHNSMKANIAEHLNELAEALKNVETKQIVIYQR